MVAITLRESHSAFDNGWSANIICETPLRDEDSLRMKEIYENLI